MNENTAPSDGRTGTPSRQADLARRIAVRCEQLGLTREEAANRAGMSPRYLQQVLDSGADFDPAGLLRLAVALEMTYRELLEGPATPPPGQAPAADHPMLMKLTTRECWDRLDTHGIGRVALSVRPGPSVLPVNYTVDGGTVAYRTDPDGAAAAAPGAEVSFEVDHVDEHLRTGWSVLIVGTAEHVTDPDAVQRLTERAGTKPWAGGRRDLWIRIVPADITGRLIRTV
ncbi:helix-turn-helix domain-containing protein [Actinacidiphila soli]|uniref:helix-turn-helix domain-containing protein n=1 Tax=Actinacidiphila soli TaxID=2487275 RepID=UPI001F0CB7E5|nr:pyridoxamine 5'-phosphate oxidase family protein [Actinacidiphila soli]